MALDSHDITVLYEGHAMALLRFFARRSCDPQVAADLLGETFARAFAQRKRFRGSTHEEAVGWIYAIARNQLADYMRKGNVETRALRRLGIDRPQLSEDAYDLIEEHSSIVELRAQLPAALAQLGPEQREALQLRIVEECSYEELAERLSISKDAARARVSRGLRALRDLLLPPQGTDCPSHV